MPSKRRFLFHIGTLTLGLCSILNAQLVTTPKFPTPRNNHKPSCAGCVRDLSGRISTNPAPVRAFRSSHPCPSTGSVKGACNGYVVDHIKPLDRGGSDTPQNMRWRTIAQATKGRAK